MGVTVITILLRQLKHLLVDKNYSVIIFIQRLFLSLLVHCNTQFPLSVEVHVTYTRNMKSILSGIKVSEYWCGWQTLPSCFYHERQLYYCNDLLIFQSHKLDLATRYQYSHTLILIRLLDHRQCSLWVQRCSPGIYVGVDGYNSSYRGAAWERVSYQTI